MGFKPEVSVPKCHHIWMQIQTEIGTGSDAGTKRYTHKCPKCHYVKTTVRRILPPREKRSEGS